jgi:glycosyltransferase involved in cell wall biosynthesis
LNRKGLRAAFESLYLPFKSMTCGLDVLHTPTDGGVYWKSNHALVASLMGIAARHFPEVHPTHTRIGQYWRMALSARAVDMILTISESSKKDLVEMFSIPPEKVKVTYLGVDPVFYPRSKEGEEATEIRKKYELPERYILFVGNLEPRKNITSLIKAFELIEARTEADLVIVGRKAWLYDAIFQTAANSKFCDRIHFTGYVDQTDLPWIYSLATVFVFPSLFEGFGIPNLESMACGTPVISSNISSVPEVVGDAGILVEPRNIEQIADAMLRVIDDTSLSHRLSLAGIARAKQFSWRRTAQETLDVYRSVA